MNVLCVGYRDWALSIYHQIAQRLNNINFTIIDNKEQYDSISIEQHNPDYILFYGWSWIIDDSIIKRYRCIMLHPSKLPKYRGGSPIQNQIIAGESESAVTLFLMSEKMDAGGIYFQQDISLDGHIQDIFNRIIKTGIIGTIQLLTEQLMPKPQDETKATYCKRRLAHQSEITMDELQNQSTQYLYNKIRMLEDPYPNAFIKTKDGQKLIIKYAELSDY